MVAAGNNVAYPHFFAVEALLLLNPATLVDPPRTVDFIVRLVLEGGGPTFSTSGVLKQG